MEDRNDIIRSMIAMSARDHRQQEGTSTPNGPVDIFSRFDLTIINQVRQEYMESQSGNGAAAPEPTLDSLLDSLAHEKTITRKLELALDRMKNEIPLLQMITECQSTQDAKERQLYQERNTLLEKHQSQLDTILAKEWIGAKIADEKRLFKEKAAEELDQMDRLILREFDLEIRRQQELFKKVKLPSFYVTRDPSVISLQQSILALIKTKTNE